MYRPEVILPTQATETHSPQHCPTHGTARLTVPRCPYTQWPLTRCSPACPGATGLVFPLAPQVPRSGTHPPEWPTSAPHLS